MRYLLDTHVWLWMLTEPARLGEAESLIADDRNDLALSAASTWEIALKFSLGKLPLPRRPAVYVPQMIRSTGVKPLAVEHAHAAAVADLPELHRDPFDRILVAQAAAEKLILITADAVLSRYDVETLLI